MSRPRKCRRICRMPATTEFIPASGSNDVVVLSIDEYESTRLMDHEGLNQEQAALQMNVARATVTCIYEAARRKIADALVDGRRILIQGGTYKLCEHAEHCCGRCGCGGCQDCDNTACKVCMQGK